MEKQALIAEVKLNKENIAHDILKEKSKILILNLQGYDIEYKGFSLEDM